MIPGVAAPALAGISGQSRDGQPLAYQRAPAADLAPWIARMFFTQAEQPAGRVIDCGLFNDTAFVRLIAQGDWTAAAANGTVRCSRGALLFGPHSRMLPITVAGPFATFGFALRPGALAALGHPWGPIGNDMIADLPSGPDWRCWTEPIDLAARSPEQWLGWLEDTVRAVFSVDPPRRPDPLALAFDEAAFVDPGEPIAAFAARLGVSKRRVARMARRDFGLPPKAVMRRARVLDLASQLLGFADPAEAEDHALRFYDQSHRIREFRALMGMTPSELARGPRPILTLGLESRQARRLEVIGRLAEGEAGPWR